MSIAWTRYNLHVVLNENMLGTIPKNPEVYERHVRSQLAGNDETVPEPTDEEVEEKGWTTFYTDASGRPLQFNYQVKGFLKEAGNVLKGNSGVDVKNLRSHVENEVFVHPRSQILADKPDGVLERPLRAMTMQGPRVTVVRSDFIQAGREYDWTLKVLTGGKVTQKVLEALLEYGEEKGLGQWRNGGYGSFTGTLTRVDD